MEQKPNQTSTTLTTHFAQPRFSAVLIFAVMGLILLPRIVLGQSDTGRRAAVLVEDPGFHSHSVESEFQSGATQIRVLTPRDVSPGRRFPVLYLLPVEADDGNRYGDGLVEAQRIGLPDKHGVICVAPTFSQLPWYADHPTNPQWRQESHLLKVVVPTVDRLYPTVPQARSRFLVGFSKSGWGAYSLLLRHPEVFGQAGAWDAPWLMDWPSRYGSQPIFGTEVNFVKYQIMGLFTQRAELLRQADRLVLAGHGNFRAETEGAELKLKSLGIPHTYLDGPDRKHDWHSGWLAEVCEKLLTDSRRQETSRGQK